MKRLQRTFAIALMFACVHFGHCEAATASDVVGVAEKLKVLFDESLNSGELDYDTFAQLSDEYRAKVGDYPFLTKKNAAGEIGAIFDCSLAMTQSFLAVKQKGDAIVFKSNSGGIEQHPRAAFGLTGATEFGPILTALALFKTKSNEQLSKK